MKRSFINKIIEETIAYLTKRQFYLPKWAYWNYGQWQKNKGDCAAVFAANLGWDVTDSGGKFDKNGLVLFTVRNGILGESTRRYCEKIILMKAGQVCPYHYHKAKTEDIINRGNEKLAFKIAKAENEQLGADDVTVTIDGIDYTYPACEEIILDPGQSIVLYPHDYHMFYPVSGAVLIGEVSTVNNDAADNYFLETVARFPSVEEDEPIRYPIVGDYSNL